MLIKDAIKTAKETNEPRIKNLTDHLDGEKYTMTQRNLLFHEEAIVIFKVPKGKKFKLEEPSGRPSFRAMRRGVCDVNLRDGLKPKDGIIIGRVEVKGRENSYSNDLETVNWPYLNIYPVGEDEGNPTHELLINSQGFNDLPDLPLCWATGDKKRPSRIELHKLS